MGASRSTSTQEKVLACLQHDLFPYIGSMPAAAIKPRDILGLIQRVEARGAIDSAHRMKHDINALFAEQVKVIYEIACLEFGPAFVRGAEGARIREFLRAKCSGIASDEGWLEASRSLGMAPFINQQISEFVDQITAGQRCSVHIALVTPAGIVCSLLGVGITFPTEKVEYDFAIEDARAYVSYIDGSFGCILPFHKLPELADIRERTRNGR